MRFGLSIGLLAVFPLFVVTACTKDDVESDSSETSTQVERFEVTPNVAGVGTRLDVALHANTSAFEFGETGLNLGDGITIEQVTVSDGYNAVATVVIDPDADLGLRDATISIKGDDTVLPAAFEVISESFRIEPSAALMGETVEVAIVGTATDWRPDYTWPGFGEDVEVLDFSVLSSTLASARLAIHPNARPGPRDVAMNEGTHVVTLYDGFTVDRQVITAFFDPPSGYQGDSLPFTITGLDTDFIDATSIQFWDDGGTNADIQITDLTVIDRENMTGHMRLSNAARIGSRDVLISYEDESILVPDAFEVLDAPPNLNNVYVGLGFDVDRSIDNSSGDIVDDVSAIAYFIIPLDPPCYGNSSSGEGPQPYDQNGVWPVPPEPEPVDCPNAETVSAGDFVWFEGPENVVTLNKDMIEATGQIIYTGDNLTLADYHFNTMYDLHTQGDPDGIPEVTLIDVQPTVPADYYFTSPSFWGDMTVSRTEDFPYSWTPAQTYPDAQFGTQISGTLTGTEDGGFAGSLPWDDGEHQYTAEELQQLNPGPVSFSAYSYIEGPYFGLPFSSIQTCQSDSTLSTAAYMILE